MQPLFHVESVRRALGLIEQQNANRLRMEANEQTMMNNELLMEQNALAAESNEIAEKARRDASVAVVVPTVQRHNTNRLLR